VIYSVLGEHHNKMLVDIKGLVHPKIKILSLFTHHPQVVTNPL